MALKMTRYKSFFFFWFVVSKLSQSKCLNVPSINVLEGAFSISGHHSVSEVI